MDVLETLNLYVGESPCEKFKCEFYNHCSEKKMACACFENFVTYGKASHELFCSNPLPSIKIYRNLFGANK